MNILLRSVDWKEAILGLALMAGLVATSFHNYLLFHTFAEFFSIIIAYGVFMLAWNTRRYMDNGYLLFVGISYFFVALLDLLHTLAYKGMPIFPGFNGNNLPPQIWMVARYMESLSLLAAPLFLRRALAVVPVFLGYAAVTGLALLSIFFWRNFPDCFVDGQGLTPFKIVSEYVICAILAGAAWLLWVNRGKFSPLVMRYLILSLAATIATELCFTAYKNLYATINMVGHLFKILSFYFMYRAIIETGLTNPFEFMFRDLQMEIEERRKAEQALLQSRELLDRTQKAGGIGGFELDFQTGLMALTGPGRLIIPVPEDSAPSFDALVQMLDPRDRLVLMEAFDHTRETGASLDAEVRLEDGAGGGKWIRFSGGLGERGGKMALSGVIQDVSDKKRLEILREDIERMSRHDLKSPLNAIIGLPGLILSDRDMPRQEIDEYMRLIRQTGYKMLNLINISLDMFKMEQGTYEFQAKPVDMTDLAGKLAMEAAGKLRARKLGLEISVDGSRPEDAPPFMVLGEELPLWSMLGNLLDNAIGASPREGVVRLALERDGGAARILVSNKGAVPEDIRPRFFEKYATSGKEGGTGLGTYSASLIARTMGGSIGLDVSDPEGTTVTVTLPLAV